LFEKVPNLVDESIVNIMMTYDVTNDVCELLKRMIQNQAKQLRNDEMIIKQNGIYLFVCKYNIYLFCIGKTINILTAKQSLIPVDAANMIIKCQVINLNLLKGDTETVFAISFISKAFGDSYLSDKVVEQTLRSTKSAMTPEKVDLLKGKLNTYQL
jgi:hypothetical protein